VHTLSSTVVYEMVKSSVILFVLTALTAVFGVHGLVPFDAIIPTSTSGSALCRVKCADKTYKQVRCSQKCTAIPQVCRGSSSSGGTVQCGYGAVQSCSRSACKPACKTRCGASDCGRTSNRCGGYLSCRPCERPCNVNGGYCAGTRRLCQSDSDCSRGTCNRC